MLAPEMAFSARLTADHDSTNEQRLNGQFVPDGTWA
jgi:hypothetical protein